MLGRLALLFVVIPLLELAVLIQVGQVVGLPATILLVLATGVAGAALFVGKYPDFQGPLIGASGAIAGAMGAFLVCFAHTKIKFFYWLGIFFGTFSAPASTASSSTSG